MKLHVYDTLREYTDKKPQRFHMPGHKGKNILPSLFSELDITELDYVDIVGAVKEAESDIAKELGAKSCVMKTDGASMCIFAMINAVKDRGNKIVITKNSHKSVYNALEILGIDPIIIEKESDILSADFSKKYGVENGIKNADLIGCLFTYPDYYGNVFDIKSISKALKSNKKLLLIDNSHGGHYKFFPLIYAGEYADIWVDSIHKVFSALNQSALILTNEKSLTEKIRTSADIFSTTSPSYPILASMEYGIKSLAENRERKNFFHHINNIKSLLKGSGFAVYENDDPYKLVIDCLGSDMDVDGFANGLKDKKIYFEMNDGRNIVFMFSIENTFEELDRLTQTVIKLKKQVGKYKGEKRNAILTERKVSYLTARKNGYKLIPLNKAEGETAQENAGRFPPCCPTVVAGEIITKEIITELSNVNTFGIYGGKIKVIQ